MVERVPERTDHVLLTHQRVERGGPEFARQNLITHDPAL
jgi:hypothetical protein